MTRTRSHGLITGILAAAAAGMLLALFIQFAWNLVFPAVFGWSELTYTAALGITLFIGILVPIFGHGRSARSERCIRSKATAGKSEAGS